MADHVLLTTETCPCDPESDQKCPVCDYGLSICSLCGKAEAGLDGPCVSPMEMAIVSILDKENARLRLALEAVTIFFSPPGWDSWRATRWNEIVRVPEATTRTLCSHVRAVLDGKDRADQT